jgi:hypothetical protein
MLKVVIIGAVATFAVASVARAADLPRPQPVYSEAPIGKAPIGKGPIGKGPVGKMPIGKAPAPIVTKG